MNRQIVKTKFEEGDEAKAYKCTAGKWTVGAGINIEQQPLPKAVRTLWEHTEHVPDNWVIMLLGGGEMPQKVRDLWLDIILSELEAELECEHISCAFTPGFEDLDLVLLDMAYQMGIEGLCGFKRMIAAINCCSYNVAALELLDSKYAREDSPNRARRNAELLRGLQRWQ